MKKNLNFLFLFLSILYFNDTFAQDCQGGISLYNLNENNVNALINNTGQIWWDGTGEPGYEFPPGLGNHLLFGGSLWLGGIDPSGNLKLAAQTYGSANGDFDFFPGPIDPATGSVTQDDCNLWDLIFEAKRSDILMFLSDFNDNGQIDNPLPTTIAGWPAQGNINFESVHGFSLPDKSLAPFVDRDEDGIYEPLDGDYPKIKGTRAAWWVINDVGNFHSDSGGEQLKMEIQTMAYAYNSGDELVRNTTFYDYKMIYYGEESLSNYYTSLWIDPDIGCPSNDFIGSLPAKNLGYAYNGETLDFLTCGSMGYADVIPMVGIKILKNTTTQDGMMTGFSHYFNGGGFPTPPPGTADPGQPQEFYNYMQGLWQDGTPLSQGGNGYNPNGEPYPFAFDNSLINGTPWTECTAFNPWGDRRFLMNFGPITLVPGQIQELNFAVVPKTDVLYPCPAIDGLVEDTDLIASFDSLQNELQENPVPMAPLAGFSVEFLTQTEIAFSDNSFFDPTEWVWDFGDGNTSTERFPTHIYTEEGTYTICLTASNSLGSDTFCRDVVITIVLAPEADFNFNSSNAIAVFQDASTNNPTAHFWDFDDGTTSTQPSLLHAFPSLGIYNVCLTVANVGGEDTICKEVELQTTSTDEILAIDYKLYPNPASKFLYLEFSESVSQNLDIQFFDILGKVVNPKVQKNGVQFEISVDELPKGVYFFELFEKEEKRGTGKFIVN